MHKPSTPAAKRALQAVAMHRRCPYMARKFAVKHNVLRLFTLARQLSVVESLPC